MRLKSPSIKWACALILFLACLVGACESRAADSGTGYTCTTGADGVVTCTGPASSSSTGTTTPTGGSGSGSGTGWLTQFTGWLSSAASSVVNGVRDIAKDMVVWALKAVLDVFLLAVSAIGVPAFIADYGLGSLLAHVSPVLGYFVTQLKIGASLALIGAGYAFRLLRKLLTLGQW